MQQAVEVPQEARLLPVPMPPPIEDFVIVKPISRGAFGKVYLARRKINGKLYAVKVVKKADMINKNMVQQVQAERDALALSKSPFIVHLYYSLQSANNVYLVMEYLIGGDVKSLLHIYGYFDEEMALKFASEVALALDYLHRHGIIHRDLKPDNMLLSNLGHIKLTDFGLSKVALKRELNMVDILTTPSMAKPKQDYSRTPGQVLSLISSLGFHTPGGGKMHAHFQTPAAVSTDNLQGTFSTPMAVNPKEKKLNASKLLISCPDNSAFSPTIPVKCLTPNLLRCRVRFGTSSASSQSHVCPSSMESECSSSPRWEKDTQESEMGLPTDEMKHSSVSEKLANRKPPNDKESKRVPEKGLDFMDTPSGSNNITSKQEMQPEPLELKDTPLVTSNVKGFVRKCLYKKGTWAEEDLVLDETGAVDNTVDLCNFQISSSPVDHSSLDATKCKKEEENSEKAGGKRMFELVDKSPSQVLAQYKKSNAEYKRGCEITNCTLKPNTGLTEDIVSLMLSANQCHNDDYVNMEKRDENYISGQQTSDNLPNPTVAKNLLCELDEQCDKDGKKNNLNSSILSNDAKDFPRSSSAESDSSSHNMSITECQLENQLSDLNKGVKELSFEETKTENGLVMLSSCQEAQDIVVDRRTDHAVQLKKHLHPEATAQKRFPEGFNDVWASPALGKIKPFSDLKNKNVMFRSYNSAIVESNISEPSRMSIASVEKMDFSPAYSGSYSMAFTPGQKGQSCNIFQGNVETPYRTPKSVRRGVAPVEKERILGTPDYLAPELLLGTPHGSAVDWWALGVCLFEFLTGIPPFNDETPALVFQNILKRDIPWPEGEEKLSANAQTAIEILLATDSTKRAGLKDLKRHPLFHGLDWNNLQNQPMPFIPQPDDETDTTYFEARNNAQHLTVSGFSL